MYRCGCGWTGSELAYIGFTPLAHHSRTAQTLLRRGQGVCPQCERSFQGCVHPSVYDELRQVAGQSLEEGQISE